MAILRHSTSSLGCPVNEYKVASWFEFDEHRHLITQDDGAPVASVRFSHLSEGRENAVNCMATVKILFGADNPESVDPVMEYQRVNLTNRTSANGWKAVVEALENVGTERGWQQVVQKLISGSLKNWYEGSASHAQLERVDLRKVPSPFLINPLVSSTGMTMHYSRPGSAKSYVALAAAVSVATGYPVLGAVPATVGPVVYVDFEDDISEHNKRVTAILNAIDWDGDMPDIVHYKVAGRLVDQLSQIRSVVRKKGAVMVVVDSLGKARNTDASDGDATIKLTNAIESFGIPVLAIDHVTKVDNAAIANGKVTNPDAMMAIGSQFSTAGARLGWMFQEMSDSTYEVKRYNLHNTKHNHTIKQKPRSIKVEFINDDRGVAQQVKFSMWDVLKFEEFTADTMEHMILKWFAHNHVETATTKTIADGLGAKDTTVNSALQNEELFKRLTKEGRNQPYGLTEDGLSESERLTSAHHGDNP